MSIINLVGNTTLMQPSVSSFTNSITISGEVQQTLVDDNYKNLEVKFKNYDDIDDKIIKKIEGLPIQFNISEKKENVTYFNTVHFTSAAFNAYKSQVDCLLFLNSTQISNLLIIFSKDTKKSFNISFKSDRVFGEDDFIDIEDRYEDNEKPFLDGSKDDLQHFEISNYEFFQNFLQDNI